MKYIDADRLRAYIERQAKSIDNATGDFAEGRRLEQRIILSFLDTLEEPEQPTRGYDEAYLNEKIAKASKSWKGVDVDKYMDEVRGREPVSENLEEEVKRYYSDNFEYISSDQPTLSILTNIARHFAEWGAEHSGCSEIPDDLVEAADKSAAQYYKDAGYSPFPNVETAAHKSGFFAGAEWQKGQVLSLIESRISQIMGDAQPRPALRAELRDLIGQIKG